MTVLSLPRRTLQLKLLAKWELAARDPLQFMRWFVFSNKPEIIDGERRNRVTPFPWTRPHVVACTRLWMGNQVLQFLKCRQVLLTWWLAAISLWDAIFHPNRLIMMQARRLEDVVGDRWTGDGLFGRAQFILDHIPGRGILGLRSGTQVREGMERLVFKHNRSTLWPIPQGGKQIRQHTPSGIASDETAFQDEFADAFNAAIPAIRSGAWFVGVSTADLSDGGFTRKLIKDLPDDDV